MNIRKSLYIFLLISTLVNNVNARQIYVAARPGQEYLTRDSVVKGPYTLIFLNLDTTFARYGARVKQLMENTFFKVYPQEANVFNKNAMRKVVFLIDPAYDGVAQTEDGTIRFNAAWMLREPTDIDVVTHEVMHIVQGYGYGSGPVWLTEGLADYARYKFGVDNAGADWTMPDYQPGQNYTDSYRITARFFVWLEEKESPGILVKINSLLRSHTYTSNSWKQLTGKTIDELWGSYANNPVI